MSTRLVGCATAGDCAISSVFSSAVRMFLILYLSSGLCLTIIFHSCCYMNMPLIECLDYAEYLVIVFLLYKLDSQSLHFEVVQETLCVFLRHHRQEYKVFRCRTTLVKFLLQQLLLVDFFVVCSDSKPRGTSSNYSNNWLLMSSWGFICS